MKIKLCRLFNKKYLIELIASVTVLAAMLLALDGFDGIVFILCVLILVLSGTFRYPNKFELEDERISVCEFRKIRGARFSFVIRRGYARYKRAYIEIEKITKIEYISTWIERIFDLGHIKIHGNVRMNQKNGEPFDEFDVPQEHVIYAIKHFKNMKEKIKQALPRAEHCEIQGEQHEDK